MVRHPRLLAASVASVGLALSVACVPAASAADLGSLEVTVDGGLGALIGGIAPLRVVGDTTVAVRTASLDGGELTVVPGPDADLPKAVHFPAYDASGLYPRAVLSLTPLLGDALNPGSDDFKYGAVFKVDATSSGRTSDDGDNVFQRGRFADDSIFKLQVDHGRASCLVKGSAGSVLVKTPTQVPDETWLTATCARVGSRVTVTVTPYDGGSTVSASESGDTGELSFDPARPASVGGKLTRLGAVASSTDQFNGAVARVFVDRI